MQHDLVKAVEFYKNLDFKLKFHLKDQWAEFVIGDVKVGLCPTKQELPDRNTGIVLEIDDVHSAYKTMQEHMTFLGEPKEAVHGIMVSFKDPGGNIVDLYQPTPEKVEELMHQQAQEKDGDCCGNDESCDKA